MSTNIILNSTKLNYFFFLTFLFVLELLFLIKEIVFVGASLGSLSIGRLSIVNICVAYITKAVPIALRYTGVRKQFGPPNEEEIPVLEYQLVVRINYLLILFLMFNLTHLCWLFKYIYLVYVQFCFT